MSNIANLGYPCHRVGWLTQNLLHAESERSRDYIGTPSLYIPTFIGNLRTDISFLLNLNIRLLIVGFSLTENRVMVDHQLSPENVNTIAYGFV